MWREMRVCVEGDESVCGGRNVCVEGGMCVWREMRVCVEGDESVCGGR